MHVAVQLGLGPDGDHRNRLQILLLIKIEVGCLRPVSLHVRLLQKELASEKIPVVDPANDDGCCVVDQTVGAAVGDGGSGLVQMAQDVIVAQPTFQLTARLPVVKLSADLLPGSGCEDVPFIVDDRRGKRIDLVEPVLQILEMIQINQVLQLVSHNSTLVSKAPMWLKMPWPRPPHKPSVTVFLVAQHGSHNPGVDRPEWRHVAKPCGCSRPCRPADRARVFASMKIRH